MNENLRDPLFNALSRLPAQTPDAVRAKRVRARCRRAMHERVQRPPDRGTAEPLVVATRQGLERLRPGQSYVLISNHLSNFDIWCTLARMPFTVRFVAKKELLRLPFFGQALALSDHIVIDRQNPMGAIEKINTATARTPDGIGILFYAEGTRSRDGKVHEFKKGGDGRR